MIGFLSDMFASMLGAGYEMLMFPEDEKIKREQEAEDAHHDRLTKEGSSRTDRIKPPDY